VSRAIAIGRTGHPSAFARVKAFDTNVPAVGKHQHGRWPARSCGFVVQAIISPHISSNLGLERQLRCQIAEPRPSILPCPTIALSSASRTRIRSLPLASPFLWRPLIMFAFVHTGAAAKHCTGLKIQSDAAPKNWRRRQERSPEARQPCQIPGWYRPQQRSCTCAVYGCARTLGKSAAPAVRVQALRKLLRSTDARLVMRVITAWRWLQFS